MMLRALQRSSGIFLILATGLVAVGPLVVLFFVAENLTTFARTGLLLFGLLPCLAAGWLYHFVTTSLLQPLSKSLALLQKALVQKDLLRNDLLQKDAATQIPALPHRGINRLADCLSLPGCSTPVCYTKTNGRCSRSPRQTGR